MICPVCEKPGVVMVSPDEQGYLCTTCGATWAAEVETFEIESQIEYLGGPIVVELTMNAAQLPTRAYDGDAGYDLYVSESLVVEPRGFRDVNCGIRCAFPEDTWAWIVGRSSTLRARGLQVQQAIIDNGYTGLIYTGVLNTRDEPVEINIGERLAQMIPMHLMAKYVGVQAGRVEEGERGNNGFGSSGR